MNTSYKEQSLMFVQIVEIKCTICSLVSSRFDLLFVINERNRLFILDKHNSNE